VDFLSAPFFGMQAILLALYWCAPDRIWQNRILLLGSLLFLFSLGKATAAILIVSTALEWAIALRLEKTETPRGRRAWLWASLVLNIGLLAILKFGRFFPSGETLFGSGSAWLKALIPVGASFWTLQKMSLTLDVYFRRRHAEKDFFACLLFAGFFPTVLSGPIEASRNFLPQLEKKRAWDVRRFSEAIWLLALGAFLKAVIADNLSPVTEVLLKPGARGGSVLLGGYAYALQLYGDFAGYSYMARGIARAYGIDITQNFLAPFLTRNLSDFWKHWHASLTAFLNEYVFGPVSMRLRDRGTFGIVFAICATFLASGIWHGTGWLYVAYGGIHAAGISFLAMTRTWRKRMVTRFGKEGWYAIVCILVTFHWVVMSFLVFRSADLTDALAQLGALFRGGWGLSGVSVDWATLGLSGLAVLWLQSRVLASRDVFWIFARPVWFRVAFYLVLGFLLTRFFAPPDRFIYFQF
jgi:alginate O-acetyltransferase complex protein AlgI